MIEGLGFLILLLVALMFEGKQGAEQYSKSYREFKEERNGK